MTIPEAIATIAVMGLFALLFVAVTRPASASGSPQATKELIMQLSDAATAIESAATSMNTAATGLTTAAEAIAKLNDTSALDQPIADLGSAQTKFQTAVQAVLTAAGVQTS